MDPERQCLLNQGMIASATLTEVLSVDFSELIQIIFPEIPAEDVSECLAEGKKIGISKKMQITARMIHEYLPDIDLSFFLNHPSDTVRGWGCFLVGSLPDLTLTERFERIYPFADDPHFGVREWSWMALRDYVVDNVDETIDLLLPWTQDSSERIRRFVAEILRPRGVWSTHIQCLKDEPQKVLAILQALKEDDSVYVQHAVGNWLNDASKHQPEWVTALCDEWIKNPQAIGTIKICQRATRTLRKKEKTQKKQKK